MQSSCTYRKSESQEVKKYNIYSSQPFVSYSSSAGGASVWA